MIFHCAFFIIIAFSMTKPPVEPWVEKPWQKKKVKKFVRPTKEKEWYGGSERKAGIFAKSVPLAECYEVPKRTGLPVAGQTMR